MGPYFMTIIIGRVVWDKNALKNVNTVNQQPLALNVLLLYLNKHI